MKIAIAADHAGFVLKNRLREALAADGYAVEDLGADSADSTDYPDFAAAVGERVADGRADRGVLVCSSGAGMAIAANKVIGIRAAVGTGEEQVRLTREHNDANVLALGAKFIGEAEAKALVRAFLETPFDRGARHVRRIGKIARIEQQQGATAGKS